MGAMLIGVGFQEIGHWRPATLYIGIIPIAIMFILVYFFVQESPKFLLRKGPVEACRVLNWIGKINTGNPELVRPAELIEPIEREK